MGWNGRESVNNFTFYVDSGPILVICHSGISWHPAGFSLIYLHTLHN
jgi:hypothetical protein